VDSEGLNYDSCLSCLVLVDIDLKLCIFKLS